MLSKVDFLAAKLHKRWIHKWYHSFSDKEFGGFHERLGENFKPVDMPHKRLVTQCRQLAVYSHATLVDNGIDFGEDLQDRFGFLKNNYFVPETGGWRFSVFSDGHPAEGTYDLYGNAFAIFSLCFYYQLHPKPEVKEMAQKTLEFIDRHFRCQTHPGFLEALGCDLQPLEKIRRQNPHMHLFEACLFAYEVWQEPAYLQMADELYELFCKYFYDDASQTLEEFFEVDLSPHKVKGGHIEPGHHFEWVWLLKKYSDIKGVTPLLQHQQEGLLHFANTHGYDHKFGGIFDVVDKEGHPIKKSKRVWPFTEGLKANAMMMDYDTADKDFIKGRVKEMIHVFNKKYMEPRGFWTESLTQDLSPATNYMPGTTPYHVYFGIVETLKFLENRGKSKSWFSGPKRALYAARRRVSFAKN